MSRLTCSILIFFVLVPAYGHVSSDSLETKINAVLNKYDKPNAPGLTVGIVDNGKLVFAKGYGMADIERGTPNSPSIAYKVASVSKQFTAAAVLDMARRN